MPIWVGRKPLNGFEGGFLSLVLLLGLALPFQLTGCPTLLLAQQIPFNQHGTIKREQLQLYSFQGRTQTWKPLALQLDPLDMEYNHVFPLESDWRQKNLTPRDRLSFHAQSFGDRATDGAALPCLSATNDLIELKIVNKYAYLAVCKNPPLHKKINEPVHLDEKQRLVQTQFYRYRYSERNHLVFDDIQLVDSSLKVFETAALRSDLVIIGDVKNFFTLVFDTDDIDAQIKHKRSGEIGLIGGLQFFLRILAFRIEMELRPEVDFFEDSLFMPMTMYLPINATKYFRRGSGIYYTWDSGEHTEWLIAESKIQRLDPRTIDPKYTGPFDETLNSYCSTEACHYRLLGKIRGRQFSLNFVIKRHLAELGFFPRLIVDAAAFEKLLGRPLSRFPGSGRMGVYFETARLPQGTAKWDFWIRVLDKEAGPCDKPVSISLKKAGK